MTALLYYFAQQAMLGYAGLFVLVLCLALVMAKRKERAALIVTVVFAVPIGLLASLYATVWVFAQLEHYSERRRFANFQEVCQKQGAQIIHAREANVPGIALAVVDQRALPFGLRNLSKPEHLLGRGYSFLEVDRERYLQADRYSQSRVVGTPAESRFVLTLKGESTKAKDGTDVAARLRIESTEGKLLAETKWLHHPKYGTCPSLRTKGSYSEVGAVLDFITTVLAPEAHGTATVAMKMGEMRVAVKNLNSYPERIPADQVHAHFKKARDCGGAVEFPDKRADMTTLYHQLYFNVSGERRIVSSETLSIEQAFCKGNEVYAVARFHESFVLAHYDKRGTRTGLQRVFLDGRRSVQSQQQDVPVVFDLTVSKDKASFKRIHLYAPLPPGQPSYRVKDAYLAEVNLPPGF